MKIAAAKFKATCLTLMDRVATTGETVVITKRGKAVAKLTRVGVDTQQSSVIGSMAGSVLANASEVELFSTGESWNAND